MKQNENIDVSGHLEIYKVYEDGTQEQVFNELTQKGYKCRILTF